VENRFIKTDIPQMKRCDIKPIPQSKRCQYDVTGSRATAPAAAASSASAATAAADNDADDDDAAAAAAMADRQPLMQVEELVHAADCNDLAAVQRLLQHESELNGAAICNGMSTYDSSEPPFDGVEEVTALHMASFHGHVEIVRYLLHHPSCDPNIPTSSQKETALHFACEFGHDDVVVELLQHQKIRLDLTDRSGYTALFYAVFAPSLSITQRLCRYVHERGSSSSSCCSSSSGGETMASSVAEALDWINQPDRVGGTALYRAVERGDSPLVKCLLEFGADRCCPEDRRGQTPFYAAIVSDYFRNRINPNMMELVPLLFNHRNRLPSRELCTLNNHTGETGGREEHDAENNQDKLQWINATDCHGDTALHYIVQEMSDQDSRLHYDSLSETLQIFTTSRRGHE